MEFNITVKVPQKTLFSLLVGLGLAIAILL